MNQPNDGKGDVLKLTPEECAGLERNLHKITGITAKTGAERILSQMASMQVWGRNGTDEQKILEAAELIADFEPTNPSEALLITQMSGVHEAAVLFLMRATLDGQTFEGADANVLRASRLMRLFNEQVELLAKLKGKTSQQKVTVEHVHVHQGGQAIVGALSTAKADQGEG